MASGARLGRYDPRSVKATWGVITLLNGVADGTFITLDRRARTWTLPVGVDGEAARVRTNDFTGIVTFTLRNGSLTSTALPVLGRTVSLDTLCITRSSSPIRS